MRLDAEASMGSSTSIGTPGRNESRERNERDGNTGSIGTDVHGIKLW